MSARGTYGTGTVAAIVILIELIAWTIGIFLWYTLIYQPTPYRFARPEILWGLVIGPVLTILHLVGLWMKNKGLRRFSDRALLARMVPGVSSTLSTLRFLLLRHGLSFAIVALAGPETAGRQELVKAKGVNVVVAVDVSNSMLAEDLRPSRMEVARRGLTQLIEKMQGDRLGIVVFAGTAFTQLPITTDRSAAKLFLGNINPGMVATQGTALGAAIEQARKSFQHDGAQGKAIIVMSDGESFEDDGEAAATAAAGDGIVVHTIGLGTPEGAPIPERSGNQVIGFKKDRQGQTVLTKLNEDMLRRVARAGNGEYIRATNAGTGITELMTRLRGMTQAETGTYRYAGHEDRYQLFLVVACALIFAGLLMGERGPERPLWKILLP